jgi:hypothetical protein
MKKIPHTISESHYSGTGISVSIINRFSRYWRPANQVVYYPSSGEDIEAVLKLPCDSYFFSDYCHGHSSAITADRLRRISGLKIHSCDEDVIVFQYGSKWGYFLRIDNNEVIQLIQKMCGHLDIFIGVRDGCEEGGNYECVNKMPFLSKVVCLAPPTGLDLYLDHSGFFDHYPQYIFENRIIRYLGEGRFHFSEDQIAAIRHYHVTNHASEIAEWKNGLFKLTIEFDNIINHIYELDVVICSPLCRKLALLSLGEKIKNKFFIPPQNLFAAEFQNAQTANTLLLRILRISQENGWQNIGITAFGLGNHGEFLRLLKEADMKKPIWIRIFHLEDDDFSMLKEKMKREGSS